MSVKKFPAQQRTQGLMESRAWTAGGSCWHSQWALNLGKALTSCSTLTHVQTSMATGLRPMWRVE